MLPNNCKIMFYNKVVDMRKSIDGLSIIGYFPTKGDKVARPSAFKVVFIWLVVVLTCPI